MEVVADSTYLGCKFTENVLKENGVYDTKLTPKNALLGTPSPSISRITPTTIPKP